MASSKGQLVCQHLEGISRKALEKYQAIIRQFVKGRHGLYALYGRSGRLYYVGLAADLRNRLKIHLRDRHSDTWEKFSVYLTITDSCLRDLESLLQRIASPKGNRQTGKFHKSQDLKPLFRRTVSEAQRHELDDLVGDVLKKPLRTETRQVEGRKPILAPYAERSGRRFEIRYRYKGRTHRATVRKDGSISYSGKTFTSPSLAGVAVAHHPVDGWLTWKYQRSPGEWVALNELRRR